MRRLKIRKAIEEFIRQLVIDGDQAIECFAVKLDDPADSSPDGQFQKILIVSPLQFKALTIYCDRGRPNEIPQLITDFYYVLQIYLWMIVLGIIVQTAMYTAGIFLKVEDIRQFKITDVPVRSFNLGE